MPARLSAFVVWALVAASALFWGFRWHSASPGALVAVAGFGASPALSEDLGRVLGSAPKSPVLAVAPEAPAVQRYRLLGVVAARSAANARAPGVGLIAVDSAPPRAFAVGSQIEADVVLQSVSATSATLATGQGLVLGVLQAPSIGAATSSQAPAINTLPAPPVQANPPAVGLAPKSTGRQAVTTP